MDQSKIRWEGKIPVENVKWTLLSDKISFPEDFEEKRLELWEHKQEQFPSFYDGDLIKLEGWAEYTNQLTLHTSKIKFSQVLTLEKYGLPSSRWFGQLGMVFLILNMDKTHFIIGQRTHKSTYRPQFFALPGGVIEEKDLMTSLRSACLRELKEEIHLDLNIDEMNILAIFNNIEDIGLQMLIEITTMNKMEKDIIAANEEWEKNEVKWVPFNEFCDWKNKDQLNELNYLTEIKCNSD